MTSKVAIAELRGDDSEAFSEAIEQVGGLADLNTFEKAVVVKVGVFRHKAGNHTSVDIVKARSHLN